MVVFTCNNCGDSVTKPKVEKHIQYECKRKHFAVSFCCVDCLKDFNYESVKDHCQCVTEEQRYSAKGFVPKPSAEKGKRKQAGWVDIVQSVIDKKDIPNDERQFLNIIAKYDNVPRKKNKFQNFCFSSAPAYRKKGYLVDKVFDMIEAEYKALQIQNAKEKTSSNTIENQNDTNSSKKNDTIQEENSITRKGKNSSNETENLNEIAHNEVKDISKKRKKKSKKSLDAINNEKENEAVKNIESQSAKKNKKKDKKLQDNSIATEENLEVKNKNTAVQLPESAKKSKKKCKLEKNESSDVYENGISEVENLSRENGINTTENGTSQEKSEIQLSKKEKKEMKKKMKYQQELATVANGVLDVVNQPVSKKKRKIVDVEENEEPQKKILKTVLVETLQVVPDVQSGRKFEWNEAINQVLQKKKNKPMSISKVMKRVLNEYHSLNEATNKSESELEKIFLKKLRKLKNVVNDNGKVHIIEC